jgi:uncharacterized protein DUF222
LRLNRLSNKIERVRVGVEVDVFAALDHAARVEQLAAIGRMRADLDARETRLLAAMAADPAPYRDGTSDALGKQWVREDVACALRVPSVTAGAMLDTAVAVTRRFPATLAAMSDRQMCGRYGRRLAEATLHLPDAAARQVEAQVLGKAGRQTLAQFAASVRRAVLAADPRSAETRHRDAVADRRVTFTAQENGTTDVWATGLPAEQAAVLQDRIQQLADSWKGTDERCADQRRADALCFLATGAHPGRESGDGARVGLRPAVHVTVALSTLLRLDEQPGQLAGHGPIPAALARAIASDPTGTWRRLVTDGYGNLADVSSDTYRPPAPMARFVELRDVTCCHPTCRRTAVACEIDHTIDWAHGGGTCPTNLMPLCARHHHLKHDAGWGLRRLRNDTVRWLTPTGHTYDRPPPDSLPLDTTIRADSSSVTTTGQEQPPPF